MSVVEIYGGRVDRRYLMKKSKDELATMYLHALDLLERRTQPEATKPAQDLGAAIGDTGNAEADRLINRLMSSDPDFDDCADAAAFIRRMVIENKGPDGFATWKDAAVAERMKRTSGDNCCSHGIHYDNACGACIPPRGTTVYASPADALVAGDRVDAERYRHLRELMQFSTPPNKPTTMKLRAALPAPEHQPHRDWMGEHFDASVDRTVDADIRACLTAEEIPEFDASRAAIQAQKDGHG